MCWGVWSGFRWFGGFGRFVGVLVGLVIVFICFGGFLGVLVDVQGR